MVTNNNTADLKNEKNKIELTFVVNGSFYAVDGKFVHPGGNDVRNTPRIACLCRRGRIYMSLSLGPVPSLSAGLASIQWARCERSRYNFI